MKILLKTILVIIVGFSASCGLFGSKDTNQNTAVSTGTGTLEGASQSDTSNDSRESESAVPRTNAYTVRFEKGATSRAYENSVKRGGKHTYYLGASKGQLLKVNISAKENTAVFTVLDPVGNKLTDGDAGNTIFEKTLPADGKYKILVTGPTGDASYKVAFSVTGGKSAGDDEETSAGGGGITVLVKFAKGKSSASYENAVVRGDRDLYILGASAGQTMDVNISALEDNAVFQIRGPNGYLNGAEPGSDTKTWSGKLPADGKYRIIVGGTRGNATYKVNFSIN